MKTICVLSYERAGTTWLCTALNTPQTWCIFEIFSRNPALYYWNLLTVLRQSSNIPSIIVDTYQKIFNPQNLFTGVASFAKIKQNMLASDPFSIDLLLAFQQMAYSQHRNLCFKIFPEHFDNKIQFNDIVSLSDYIIINYRNNIFETFLSWKLALKTGAWTSLDKTDQGLQDTKIVWNEQEYMLFYTRIKNNIDFWKKNIREKSVIFLQYEEIHSHLSDKEKALFVQRKLAEAGLTDFDMSFENKFKKQTNYSDISLIITNLDEFRISYEKIPLYYNQ